jgi:tetratricopeptide (TPR) repeat protein
MEQLLTNSDAPADWGQIRPALDEALDSLDDTDREALLLRYFKNHDFRTIGQQLGVTDDAAQKRVSRAVELLREFFAKRGITVGAGGLVVVISANAVQAAPVGLAVTISAAVLAGTATTTSTLIAATTKTIAMTTLQKTLVTATVAVLAGAGIYEARQAAQLRDQVQTLQKQQAPLAEQVQQLQIERDAASNRAAGLTEELVEAKKNNSELLRLRGEIGVLRAQKAMANNANNDLKQQPLATARAYYDRAGTHYMNHDFEAQLDDLNKAIELDSNFAEAYFMRGNLFASSLPKQRGGLEAAIADYTRCLQIKPNYASARWNRATYLKSLGRSDEAISDWSTYLDGNTDFTFTGEGKDKALAGAHFQRGQIYQHTKRDYQQAIADYTAAIKLNAKIEDAYRCRGVCLEMLGETERAQKDFAIEPKR